MKDETTTIIKRKNKREWIASSPHLFGHLKTGTSMWLQMTLWNKTLCRCRAWTNKKVEIKRNCCAVKEKVEMTEETRTIIKRRIKREGVTSSQKNMKQDLNKIINRKNKREGGCIKREQHKTGSWLQWEKVSDDQSESPSNARASMCIVKFKIDGSQ